MEKEIMSFLKALQGVKKLKDSEGNPYACFGAYNQHNETCRAVRDTVCMLCRSVHCIGSDDWIDGFVERVLKYPVRK